MRMFVVRPQHEIDLAECANCAPVTCGVGETNVGDEKPSVRHGAIVPVNAVAGNGR